MTLPHAIHIAAALITRADGSALFVRKRGTQSFMQPGGKIDRGETATQALTRELHEELGLRLSEQRLHPLGHFEAPAAHEPGCTVKAEMFHVTLEGEVMAAAEIEEIVWVGRDEPFTRPLAPLTGDHVMPLWRRIVQAGDSAASMADR